MPSSWSLHGPEGEDWRVPVAELTDRQHALAEELRARGLGGALVQHPVDLYYLAGGRQNGVLWIPASEDGASIQFVRRSLDRARFEAGGSDAPHEVRPMPRSSEFEDVLMASGAGGTIALQHGSVPSKDVAWWSGTLGGFGSLADATPAVHSVRSVKSRWELEQMEAAAVIQHRMFEAIEAEGGEGSTELELASVAESISRSEGFGGRVFLRRWPMDCDRAVVVAGRAGGVSSYFDSAIGGTGPHPLAGMGSGFGRVRSNEPVLVDLLHLHRGYIVDATRMFSAGPLDRVWTERLEDMLTIQDAVVESLGRGDTCSAAWVRGHDLAKEMGHADHLMGMAPDQSRFLGHSVGLELDESPVVAQGFDAPMPIGGTMAIEPKVVHMEGCIGIEDTWTRTEEGLRRITAGKSLPWHIEW